MVSLAITARLATVKSGFYTVFPVSNSWNHRSGFCGRFVYNRWLQIRRAFRQNWTESDLELTCVFSLLTIINSFAGAFAVSSKKQTASKCVVKPPMDLKPSQKCTNSGLTRF